LGTKLQHDADDEYMISHQRFVLGCALELSVKAGWQLNTSTTRPTNESKRHTREMELPNPTKWKNKRPSST